MSVVHAAAGEKTVVSGMAVAVMTLVSKDAERRIKEAKEGP